MDETRAMTGEQTQGSITIQTVRSETRRRNVFGKLCKFAFVLFNLAMIAWLGSYIVEVSGRFNDATSDAIRTGIAAGTTIGVGLILIFWAAGDVVLGLLTILTRGKVVIVEERRA